MTELDLDPDQDRDRPDAERKSSGGGCWPPPSDQVIAEWQAEWDAAARDGEP